MKTKLTLLTVLLIFASCEQPKNNQAGEWVSSGEAYEIGTDENVQVIKDMMSAYNKMDTDAMQEVLADTLTIYLASQKEPISLPKEMTPQWMAQYDSVNVRAIYFLPYKRIGADGNDISVVQTGQLENLYWTDGRVDSLRVLNKFFINSEGKIRAIRQWDADW
jgi:hypothetical protein